MLSLGQQEMRVLAVPHIREFFSDRLWINWDETTIGPSTDANNATLRPSASAFARPSEVFDRFFGGLIDKHEAHFWSVLGDKMGLK